MEKNKIRTFFALEIDDNLRQVAQKICQHLKNQVYGDKVKWMPPENLHLTLRFLGDTDSQIIPELTLRINAVISEIKSFAIPIGEVFAFPPSRPHVIAISLLLTEELAQIVQALENSVIASGFAPETRPFLPHLTLGRLRDRRFPDLENIPFNLPQILTVNELILFRSDRGEYSSIYTPLAKWLIIEPK